MTMKVEDLTRELEEKQVREDAGTIATAKKRILKKASISLMNMA